jgi:hypothetical protein
MYKNQFQRRIQRSMMTRHCGNFRVGGRPRSLAAATFLFFF